MANKELNNSMDRSNIYMHRNGVIKVDCRSLHHTVHPKTEIELIVIFLKNILMLYTNPNYMYVYIYLIEVVISLKYDFFFINLHIIM